MGYSDHLAQTVYIKVGTPVLSPTAIQKRQFTDTAIEEIIYFLRQESWDDVLSTEDVNLAFNAFMITFMHHFNARFLIKTCHLLNNKEVKWLTKGLIVSRNRMHILNELKSSTNTPVEVYTTLRYKLIYENLVKEAKKKRK